MAKKADSAAPRPARLLSAAFLRRLEGLEKEGRRDLVPGELQRYVEDGLDEGRFAAEEVYSDMALLDRVARADDALGGYEYYCHTLRWLEKTPEAARRGPWHRWAMRAALFTGRPRQALAFAKAGLAAGALAPQDRGLAAALLAHFGEPGEARRVLDGALAAAPESGPLARLGRALADGAPLERLVLALADGDGEKAKLAALAKGFLPDPQALGRVAAALDARDWAFETPWCVCRIPFDGGEVELRLQMSEAEAAALDPGWLKGLREALPRLDGPARAAVARRHPAARLALGEVLVDRAGRVLLGYPVGRCPAEPLYAYARWERDLAGEPALADERWPSAWFDPPPEPLGPPLPPCPGYTAGQRRAVLRHIEGWFGPAGRALEGAADGIQVLVVDPAPGRDWYTLVTFGMGARRMDLPPDLEGEDLARAELLIRLPKDWQLDSEAPRWHWPVRWLRLLARMPAAEGTWLGWGHTVPNGRPFAANTQLCGSMLVDPLFLPEAAGFCPLPSGETVNFYQLLPLYPGEMDYKQAHDADSLLDEMERRELLEAPWVDVARPSATGEPVTVPDADLMETLERLDEREDDAAIAGLLAPLTASGQSPRLAGILARSLNNLGRFAEAEAALRRVAAAGASDPLWHFRLGYALYYQNRLTEARACFEAAERLAPGDGEAESYIAWCRDALEWPVCFAPFTQRAARFWAAFGPEEEKIWQVARDGGCEAARPALARLLEVVFPGAEFALSMENGRLLLAMDDQNAPHRRWLWGPWLAAGANCPALQSERWAVRCPAGGEECTGYRRAGGGEGPRGDILAGTTRFWPLAAEYFSGGQSIADAALADGAAAGFICCAPPPGAEPVAWRAGLEDAIAAAGRACLRVLGGAAGARQVYIDLLALDFERALEATAAAFAGPAGQGAGEIRFAVFRPGAREARLPDAGKTPPDVI